MRYRALLLVTVAVLAACGGGGGGGESRPSATVFGTRDTDLLRQRLSSDTGANDPVAAMFLEAGGYGAYIDMDDAEKSRLHARYGLGPAADTKPTDSNLSDAAAEPKADRDGNHSEPPDALTKRLQNAPSIPTAKPDDAAEGSAKSVTSNSTELGVTACVPYLAAPNRNLLHALGSNGRYAYQVDSEGRTAWVIANFRYGEVPTEGRDGCAPTVGTWGEPPPGTPMPINGYVGGHLIAASLGGIPARINITPQAQQINSSSFQKIESAVRTCARIPKWVMEYIVTPEYGRSPLTPDAYRDFVRIRNPWWTALNPPPGGGEGAIRIPNWTGPSPSINTLERINLNVDAFTSQVRSACPP
jgi:hypothetical protein